MYSVISLTRDSFKYFHGWLGWWRVAHLIKRQNDAFFSLAFCRKAPFSYNHLKHTIHISFDSKSIKTIMYIVLFFSFFFLGLLPDANCIILDIVRWVTQQQQSVPLWLHSLCAGQLKCCRRLPASIYRKRGGWTLPCPQGSPEWKDNGQTSQNCWHTSACIATK